MKIAALLLVACLSVSLAVAKDLDGDIVSVEERSLASRKMLGHLEAADDRGEEMFAAEGLSYRQLLSYVEEGDDDEDEHEEESDEDCGDKCKDEDEEESEEESDDDCGDKCKDEHEEESEEEDDKDCKKKCEPKKKCKEEKVCAHFDYDYGKKVCKKYKYEEKCVVVKVCKCYPGGKYGGYGH